MGTEGSITQCIHDLANGVRREDAVRELWERFYGELTRHALRKLKSMNANCQVANEEDAFERAFSKVYEAIKSGQLKLHNRDDLRRLLLTAVAREAITIYRRERRGGGQKPLDSESNPDDEIADSAALQAIEEEDVKSFLDTLNDELRLITEWRLMGHTNEEIARKLNCSLATVERKFRRIRDKWERFRGE